MNSQPQLSLLVYRGRTVIKYMCLAAYVEQGKKKKMKMCEFNDEQNREKERNYGMRC